MQDAGLHAAGMIMMGVTSRQAEDNLAELSECICVRLECSLDYAFRQPAGVDSNLRLLTG